MGTTQVYRRRSGTCIRRLESSTKCPSLEWKDLMKGPSRDAVLAHTYKILHYRSLFDTSGALRNSDWEQHFPDGEAGTSRHEQATERKAA